MELKASDLRVDYFHVGNPCFFANQNGVRVTHLPTNIYAESSDCKTQHANRAKCFEVLASKLLNYKPAPTGLELSPSLKAHLLYLGIQDVKVEDGSITGYTVREGVTRNNLTNWDVEIIIRSWKCCEGQFLDHECSDEMAEMLAEKGRVCGGGALDIYEAVIAQLKKEKGLK